MNVEITIFRHLAFYLQVQHIRAFNLRRCCLLVIKEFILQGIVLHYLLDAQPIVWFVIRLADSSEDHCSIAIDIDRVAMKVKVGLPTFGIVKLDIGNHDLLFLRKN